MMTTREEKDGMKPSLPNRVYDALFVSRGLLQSASAPPLDMARFPLFTSFDVSEFGDKISQRTKNFKLSKCAKTFK